MFKVLYLGYVWPEPNSSAAGGRTMEFLRLFRSQGWQVIFASAATLSEHRADLSSLQIEEKNITLNCDSFDTFLLAYQPDIVVFDRFFTEEQFGWRVEKKCPDALRVLDTCDLHSLREARQRIMKVHLKAHLKAQQKEECRDREDQRLIATAAINPVELYAEMLSDDMAQREIAAIYRCDLSLMISAFEMDLLRKQFAVPDFLLLETNLMLTMEPKNLPTFAARRNFISIGNFRHAPNWDAVLCLNQLIWPRIRALCPTASLTIYGAYPPPKASQLHNPSHGFHVLGWVDDAQIAMSQARVCLAPLRFGAGIKGKLADAMACGTPSVTTSLGSEGMHGDLPWGGVVTDTVDSFVKAALSLYHDEDAWLQAQQSGTEIVCTRFLREQSGEDFLLALHLALQHKFQRRRDNFTGAMLRHHLHKSTQYMSQWISLKNQAPL